MRPSVNYDHLIHEDHVHWCDIEALGVTRCEAQARQEDSQNAVGVPITDVGLSMMIAMGITLLPGIMWGMERGRAPRRSVPVEPAFSTSAVERV